MHVRNSFYIEEWQPTFLLYLTHLAFFSRLWHACGYLAKIWNTGKHSSSYRSMWKFTLVLLTYMIKNKKLAMLYFEQRQTHFILNGFPLPTLFKSLSDSIACTNTLDSLKWWSWEWCAAERESEEWRSEGGMQVREWKERTILFTFHLPTPLPINKARQRGQSVNLSHLCAFTKGTNAAAMGTVA